MDAPPDCLPVQVLSEPIMSTHHELLIFMIHGVPPGSAPEGTRCLEAPSQKQFSNPGPDEVLGTELDERLDRADSGSDTGSASSASRNRYEPQRGKHRLLAPAYNNPEEGTKPNEDFYLAPLLDRFRLTFSASEVCSSPSMSGSGGWGHWQTKNDAQPGGMRRGFCPDRPMVQHDNGAADGKT